MPRFDVSRSETGGRRLGIVGAGDDRAAVAAVMQLIDRLGFDTVDAGPLEAGLELEPDGPVFGLSSSADELVRAPVSKGRAIGATVSFAQR
jgi:predicted dinucleotide-binding enzyme